MYGRAVLDQYLPEYEQQSFKAASDLSGETKASQPIKENLGEIFYIYGLDNEANFEVATHTIRLSETMTLENKIKRLASFLSERKFNSRGIEYIGIIKRHGMRVAIINLTDSDPNDHYKCWNSAFGGSTGAMATHCSLVSTMLQEEYEGDWIDGVWYWIDGFPAMGSDHIDLSKPFYRFDKNYRVQTGDTLIGILKNVYGYKYYEIDAKELLQTVLSNNGIENPDKIFPGQTLSLPVFDD